MTKEDKEKLITFIKENEYTATDTDGWSYFSRKKVVAVDDLIKKINRMKVKKVEIKNP